MGEGHGAGPRRHARQELEQRGQAVAAADRVPGLGQVVAEAPRVQAGEERDRPVVHRADLLLHRRRENAEGLEVEARPVVGEVGGEDEERPAVVEPSEPLRERALERVVRVADEHRDEAERPERRLQERELDLHRVLALGDPGDDARLLAPQGGRRPSREGRRRSACGRASRRRGRSHGTRRGGRARRRRPARSPRASGGGRRRRRPAPSSSSPRAARRGPGGGRAGRAPAARRMRKWAPATRCARSSGYQDPARAGRRARVAGVGSGPKVAERRPGRRETAPRASTSAAGVVRPPGREPSSA